MRHLPTSGGDPWRGREVRAFRRCATPHDRSVRSRRALRFVFVRWIFLQRRPSNPPEPAMSNRILVAVAFTVLSAVGCTDKEHMNLNTALGASTKDMAVDDASGKDAVRAKLAAHRREELARLEAYAERGVFPANLTVPTPSHQLKDARGTYCAVANLAVEDGLGNVIDDALEDEQRTPLRRRPRRSALLVDPHVGSHAGRARRDPSACALRRRPRDHRPRAPAATPGSGEERRCGDWRSATTSVRWKKQIADDTDKSLDIAEERPRKKPIRRERRLDALTAVASHDRRPPPALTESTKARAVSSCARPTARSRARAARARFRTSSFPAPCRHRAHRTRALGSRGACRSPSLR